ncbi:replication fork protection component Swi3-domain-containing protein [Chytriomyces cf. hyalinus JEL632]|nr:replication fork protection component Swi3-domain-containing protein [Chytriomyces cf. hyalinus JEL632]
MDFDDDLPDLPPSLTLETLEAHRESQRASRTDPDTAASPTAPASPSNDADPIPFGNDAPIPIIETPLEIPKAKRIQKEVARLDAKRLLGPDGLDSLVTVAKTIKLKGKKHEFQDLQHILFQYQKWGHGVFNKLVFKSFIEGTEKLCRTKEIKIWRDRLLRTERLRAMGIVDDERNDFENDPVDTAEIDKSANEMTSIDAAIQRMEELDATEEQLLMDMAAAFDDPPNQTKSGEFDDIDFEAEMMQQLDVQMGGGATTSSTSKPQSIPKPLKQSHLDDDAEMDRMIAEAEADMHTTTTTTTTTAPQTTSSSTASNRVQPSSVPPEWDENDDEWYISTPATSTIKRAPTITPAPIEHEAVTASKVDTSAVVLDGSSKDLKDSNNTTAGSMDLNLAGCPTQAELEAMMAEDFDLE